MLPNEEFALACRAYYEEQGLIVDATNGEFAHCPLPRSMGETGYYLLWEHHQQQGLLQSKDLGERYFFPGNVKCWLLTCNYWPANFFDLWDVYDEFQASALSDDHKRKQSEGLKSFCKTLSHQQKVARVQPMLVKRRKEVEVTFLNGEVINYSTAHEAAKNLNVSVQSISNWARGRFAPVGVWKGIRVCYAQSKVR
jgi:hypothetical protein